MDSFKRILRIISNTIYYIVVSLLISIIIIWGWCTTHHKQPSIFGYSGYIVKSGSMKPAIDKGSIIIIKEVKPTEINEGDIITAKANSIDVTFTHRVVKKEGNYKFVTKGDANNCNDSFLTDGSNVVGKVICKIPIIGYLFMFVQQHFKLSIIVAVAIVVLFTVKGYLIEKHKITDEDEYEYIIVDEAEEDGKTEEYDK